MATMEAIVLTGSDLPIGSQTRQLVGLASLHMTCIEERKVIATFLPPLNNSAIIKWWKGKFAEVTAGKHHIIIVSTQVSGYSVIMAGAVMLRKSDNDTVPFRGAIENLLVSPRYCPNGDMMKVARLLIKKVEEVAREGGYTSLMAEVQYGSQYEAFYLAADYMAIGSIRKWGISPMDGKWKTGEIMSKDLDAEDALEAAKALASLAEGVSGS